MVASPKGALLLDIKWDSEAKVSAFQDAMPDRQVIDIAENPQVDLSEISYVAAWMPQPGLLAKIPNLKVIFSLGAGVDHLLKDPQLPNLPIVRFVDPDLTGRMNEYVALQCLMHLRQQREYDRFQRDRRWRELVQPAAHEVTVGIMGLGELGQASAAVLRTLGFKVCSWSRSPKSVESVTCYHGQDGLDEFLGQTDILVSLLPYTADTHGVLDRSLFERLNRSGPLGAPVVINGGRGKSQVEADIISCLEDGTLRGVSLDVFEEEPLSAESPLWGFDNAILTPHAAALTAPHALARHVAEQIGRVEAGKDLQHLVDRARGY